MQISWPFKLIVTFLFLVLISQQFVLAAPSKQGKFVLNDYIFKVESSGCSLQPHERSQTGFRIKGKLGVITALHGVADCTTWAARIVGKRGTFPLSIKQVNIDFDLAVLEFQESDPFDLNEGLDFEYILPDSQDNKNVSTIGYPLKAHAQIPSDRMKIRDNITLPLVTILNIDSPNYDDVITTLKDRKSPNLDVEVLFIDGILLPGHSGAPIFNADNEVIAIANGGLRAELEMTWGIPLTQVNNLEDWRDAKGKLNVAGVSALFSEKLSHNDSFAEEYQRLAIEFRSKADAQTRKISLDILAGKSGAYVLENLGTTDLDSFDIFIYKDDQLIARRASGSNNINHFDDSIPYHFRVEQHGILVVEEVINSNKCDFTVHFSDRRAGWSIPYVPVKIDPLLEDSNTDNFGSSIVGESDNKGEFKFELPCIVKRIRITVPIFDRIEDVIQNEIFIAPNETRDFSLPIKNVENEQCSGENFHLVQSGDVLYNLILANNLLNIDNNLNTVVNSFIDINNSKCEVEDTGIDCLDSVSSLSLGMCIYLPSRSEMLQKVEETNRFNTTPDGILAIPSRLTDGKPVIFVTNFNGAGISQDSTEPILRLMGDAQQPNISSDGKQILSKVAKHNADDIKEPYTILNTQNGFLCSFGTSKVRFPAWSPIGDQIAFIDADKPEGSWEVSRQENPFYKGFSCEAPKISAFIYEPTGRPIVGDYLIWTENNQLIFKSCASWIDPTLLPPQSNNLSTARSGDCGIWMTDADNINPRRIIIGLNDFPMDAQDDKLVYLSHVSGDWDVYVVSLTSQNPNNYETKPDEKDNQTQCIKNITQNSAKDGFATFSPDGSQIAYLSDVRGKWELFTSPIGDLCSSRDFGQRSWFELNLDSVAIEKFSEDDHWPEFRMEWSVQ